jgi:hypothetical protein
MSANGGGSLEPANQSKNRLLRLLAVWAFCVGSGAFAGYANSTPHDSLRGLSVGATLGLAIGALCFLVVPGISSRISDGHRLLLCGLVGLGTAIAVGLLCGASFTALVWWALIGFGLGIVSPWWLKGFTL